MAHGHGHLHHRSGPASIQEATFHVHKPMLYIRTLGALVVLMILTVAIAQVHIRDFNIFGWTLHGTMVNNFIAMGIAVAKATLVILFFMGAKYATKLTKLWVVAGFVGFVLMFLALGDYSTRVYEPVPRWTPDTGSAMMRSIKEARKDEMSRQMGHSGRFRE